MGFKFVAEVSEVVLNLLLYYEFFAIVFHRIHFAFLRNVFMSNVGIFQCLTKQ